MQLLELLLPRGSIGLYNTRLASHCTYLLLLIFRLAHALSSVPSQAVNKDPEDEPPVEVLSALYAARTAGEAAQ